jgi:hypothetical protein
MQWGQIGQIHSFERFCLKYSSSSDLPGELFLSAQYPAEIACPIIILTFNMSELFIHPLPAVKQTR